MNVVNRMKGYRANVGLNTAKAEKTAANAFSFLTSEPEYLSRFFDITGLNPAEISDVAEIPEFLTGVLDYLLNDESLLLSFCENNNLCPQDVQKAQLVLNRKTGSS